MLALTLVEFFAERDKIGVKVFFFQVLAIEHRLHGIGVEIGCMPDRKAIEFFAFCIFLFADDDRSRQT